MIAAIWPWRKPPAATCRLTDALIEEFNLLQAAGNPLDRCATLVELHQAIHDLRRQGQPRSALCLSGGGIRSASFGLGILHGLAERKLLDKFTYLSTVSGGGYIGSWLSTWRARAGDEFVTRELRQRTALHGFRESTEVSQLRAFSNFLTPKLGLLSADTWALVALYLRNLLLNWLIYLPLFAGLLLVPVLALEILRWAHQVRDGALFGGVLYGAAGLLFIALFVSVRGRLGRAKERRITQQKLILFELVPTYLAASLLSVYVATTHVERFGWTTAGLAGAVVYGAAWLAALPSLSRPGEVKTGDMHKILYRRARNLLLWLAWVASGAGAGLLIKLGAHLTAAYPVDDKALHLLAIFGVGWIAASMFLAEALYLGLTSYWRKGDSEREWLARSSGWFIAMTVCWAVWAAAALYGKVVAETAYAWIGGLVGGGIGVVVARIGQSATTAAGMVKNVREKVSTGWLLSIASIVFLVTLGVMLSSGLFLLGDRIRDTFFGEHASPLHGIYVIAPAIAACIAFAFIMSLFINVNRFSAHSLYRNRLARAFLGSARGDDGLASSTRDPLTGFDSRDNVRMTDIRPRDGSRLFHVVNMALNVVAADNRAWQERKAESFVVTPLHSGNEYVGFTPTGAFAAIDGGITLGTAMAISGAAASPNQGYHSSTLIGLVMTLFNVRLGWWLGNPSNPATVSREGPRWGIKEFFRELFGLTRDDSPYVYLSDGGHFENLGLYEMVRRRCHLIVVSDGGCDPECAFEDLGNAVRKIWIDLGVGIEFQKIDIRKRGFPSKSLYCALGTIRYPELDASNPKETGYVLYIKPGFHNDGSEPADVTAYALANVSFPHESTADQFFSESQMESYRSLGAYIIKTVLGEERAPNMDAPTESLRPYWTNLQAYLSQLQPAAPSPRWRPRTSWPQPPWQQRRKRPGSGMMP